MWLKVDECVKIISDSGKVVCTCFNIKHLLSESKAVGYNWIDRTSAHLDT